MAWIRSNIKLKSMHREIHGRRFNGAKLNKAIVRQQYSTLSCKRWRHVDKGKHKQWGRHGEKCEKQACNPTIVDPGLLSKLHVMTT